MLFIGLTRTEAGRDTLRRELEERFVENMDGRLDIGALTGNLSRRFVLSDVRLYDTDDRLWLRIDSVIARPRWNAPFLRRAWVRSVELRGPAMFARYGADGAWNLAKVLRRRGATSASALSFDSVDLLVVDGTMESQRATTRPPVVDAGWLFDIAQGKVHGINLRATVEWSAGAKLIDLFSLSALLPDVPFSIDDAQAQIVVDADRIHLNHIVLNAGSNHVQGSGIIGGFNTPVPPSLDVQLLESRLDFTSLRRIVPRLAVADMLTASMRVRGSVPDLVIENISLARGQTNVHATATLAGLPDSLDFEVEILESSVTAADLEALLPESPLPELEHLGELSLSGSARGSRSGQRLHSTMEFDLQTLAGRMAGSLSLSRAQEQAWVYTAELEADSIDLGRATQDTRMQSLLNGRAWLEGSGLKLGNLDARILLELGASSFEGRSIDTLRIDAAVAEGRLQATADARMRNTSAGALLTVDFATDLPSISLDLTTSNLNLGELLNVDSLHSALNAQWSIQGAGGWLDDLHGVLSVNVDTSVMQWGEDARTLPPHRWTVTVSDPAVDAPRLKVEGDVLSFSLAGATHFGALQSLGALWSYAGLEALGRQADNLQELKTPDGEKRSIEWPSFDQLALQGEARQSLELAGLDDLRLDMNLTVWRPDVLSAWMPMLPLLTADLIASARLDIDADELLLTGSIIADSLGVGSVKAHELDARFSVAADLSGPLEETVEADVESQALRLYANGPELAAPRITARVAPGVAPGVAHITVTTDEHEGAGPTHVTAQLEVLGDRHRLTFQDVDLNIGGYAWRHRDPEFIEIYADAVDFPGFTLEGLARAGETTQRINVQGVLSKTPGDTLSVSIEAIGLEQFSDFLDWRRSFGGRLDGKLQWTGLDWAGVTGDVSIDDLALENRILGRFEAQSHFIQGASDLAVFAALRPVNQARNAAMQVTENHLVLEGSVRLPMENDPGELDLAFDVARADAFFFEYIIKDLTEVEGALAGPGTIRGSFFDPVINAAFALTDMQMLIPDHNQRYSASGPIRVDHDGVHADQLVVTDPTGGLAIIDGSLDFNDYRFFSFDMAGYFNNLQIMNVSAFTRELPFYGMIWVSGDATLTGPISNTFIRADSLVTSPQSEVFIPIKETTGGVDPGFIVFADSTGAIPDAVVPARRETILDRIPEGERSFGDGLEMDLNILAPQGSSIQLVIDPLLGDIINGIGSARIQLQLREGDMSTYGTFTIDSGDYMFTAGEVFVRRFVIDEGAITWTGDPLNPSMDIRADYRTRASRSGLPEDVGGLLQTSLPLIVDLHVTGELNALLVNLGLVLDQRQEAISDTPLLEAYLNQPDRAAQHATSVLLTNSFLLSSEGARNDVLAGSAFNSVSHLVANQLNRYLSQVIPNADFTLGVQSDELAADLDVSAGIALRLLNERLVIRGQGVYHGLNNQAEESTTQGLEGEFVVELRLSPSVSVEVFYRREGDVLSETLITSETGVGLNFHTEFSTWRRLLHKIFGRKTYPQDATATGEL